MTPGAFSSSSRGLGGRQLAARLDVHRLGMAEEHRHAHRRRIHPDGRVAHDLLGLPEHLHLFLGVAVVLELVDLRHAVEGDLLGDDLGLRPAGRSAARRSGSASSSTASLPAPDTDW